MKKTVKIHVEDRSGLISKTVGLLPDKKPHPIYFKTRFGLHTFGMKWGIDVMILDNMNTVIKLKRHLKPNNIFFWNPLYNRVVEFPKGTLKKLDISLGDTITLLIDENRKRR